MRLYDFEMRAALHHSTGSSHVKIRACMRTKTTRLSDGSPPPDGERAGQISMNPLPACRCVRLSRVGKSRSGANASPSARLRPPVANGVRPAAPGVRDTWEACKAPRHVQLRCSTVGCPSRATRTAVDGPP